MGTHAARPRTLIIPLLALAALVTACGSSNPSGSTVAHIGAAKPTATTTADTGGLAGGGIASHYRQLIRFAQCMRAHGEPNFPDPQESAHGVILALKNVDANSPQFKAAQKACASLAPPGIAAGGSPAKTREQLDAFAACMRAHGEPNFPDPEFSSHGSGGSVRIHLGPGVNPNSPQFAKAQQACRSTLPGGTP